MIKKVLIVYASGGMGHVMAAKAIEKVFQQRYPKVTVKNINVIDFAPRWFAKSFVEGYNFISAKVPQIWGWLYQRYNDPTRKKLPAWLAQQAVEKKFISAVKAFKPDFIVSTHPLPMILISHSKHRDLIDIYSSMVVTDFGCHSLWVDPEVNYYFVASEEVRRCLTTFQVRPEQIIVTGIPIDPKFNAVPDRGAVRRQLGLAADRFTLLIVGGQFSFEDLKKIITGVKRKNASVQFIVVAGRDQKLKKALEQAKLDRGDGVKIFGFVDNMEALMTASDVIFSKAGGLTVSECLARGLPLIINQVIPGQEEDNVSYLVGKGAAVKVSGVRGVVAAAVALAADPKKIKAMKQACQKLGKPNSAAALADFICRR